MACEIEECVALFPDEKVLSWMNPEHSDKMEYDLSFFYFAERRMPNLWHLFCGYRLEYSPYRCLNKFVKVI